MWPSPDGGTEAVAAGLADLPGHAHLLDGFTKLEEGRKLPPGERADELVWRGTEAILRFEQLVHVQPQLSVLPQPFRALFSLVASADYAELGIAASPNRFSFDVFGRGFHSRLPDVGDFTQRWYWIEQRVLPRFRAAERRSPEIRAHMARSSAARRRLRARRRSAATHQGARTAPSPSSVRRRAISHAPHVQRIVDTLASAACVLEALRGGAAWNEAQELGVGAGGRCADLTVAAFVIVVARGAEGVTAGDPVKLNTTVTSAVDSTFRIDAR